MDRNINCTATFIQPPPSKPELVSPKDGAKDQPTTVTFEWKPSTDPDGDPVTYDLHYCTDNDPKLKCDAVQVTSALNKTRMNYFAKIGFGAGMVLIGISLVGGVRYRSKVLLSLSIIFLSGMLFISCNGSGETSDDTITHTVSDLDADTQYYWTVVAKDDKGGETPSEVWSFKTQ